MACIEDAVKNDLLDRLLTDVGIKIDRPVEDTEDVEMFSID